MFFCAEVKGLVFYSIFGYLVWFEEIRGIELLDFEVGFFEAGFAVWSIYSDVIVLAEKAFSFLWVGNRGVLKGFVCIDWRQYDCPAVGFQYPGHFSHGFMVVGDVFEDVAAEDDVEGIVGVADVGYVHLLCDIGPVQVSGNAVEVGYLVEPREEPSGGGDIEQLSGGCAL